MKFIKSRNLRIFTAVIILSSFFIIFQNCSHPSDSGSIVVPVKNKLLGCFDQLNQTSEWSNETEVIIDGYTGNAMEPQISSDQVTLFFNNKTSDDRQMDVHYAVKQANGHFLYIGPLSGTVDNDDLDGVPSLDLSGNFYFTSTRTYGNNFRTLFGGLLVLDAANLSNPLSVINVAAADTSFGMGQAGKVDMDMSVSWDGTLAVLSRATFSEGKGYPDESYLEMFNVNSRQLYANNQSFEFLKNVNLSGCRVYAPNLSSDLKELYYTMLAEKSPGDFDFRVVVSKRSQIAEPFGVGAIIEAIPALTTAEGPTLSYNDGGKTLYYHRKDPNDGGRFKIYKVSRP
ncbi:MAG: hypothetical protein IPM57_11900 [Oligoflexia bacterium]|nr:hypothetical protein [Oligoflexia bacterium]